jgi:hypothetical protein
VLAAERAADATALASGAAVGGVLQVFFAGHVVYSGCVVDVDNVADAKTHTQIKPD